MLKAVSLFSGCGGFDLGVKNADFSIEYSTDIWDVACKTHSANLLSKLNFCGEIAKLMPADVLAATGLEPGETDLLFGGPPCPPYSKSRFYRKEKPRALDDPAAHTLTGFLRMVEGLRPQTFILENVPGMAYEIHKAALNLITSSANALGYKTAHAILNAADFGVPQVRQRLFIVGWRTRIANFSFPVPTHSENPHLLSRANAAWITAGAALDDLDNEESARREGHRAGGRHEDLLELVPPGQNYLFFTAERGHPTPRFKWRSRYWSFLLKLSPDRPSWTIQARRSNNMGPFHWRNRILRIEEIKRLQSFPDDFQLAGSIDEQWRQIGNAVPPLLAQAVANAVKEQLLVKRNFKIDSQLIAV